MTIQCFRAPCTLTPIQSSSIGVSSLSSIPPVLSSGSDVPVYTTLPNLYEPSAPMFSTSTNELDRYRVLFLVLGVIVGAYLFSR